MDHARITQGSRKDHGRKMVDLFHFHWPFDLQKISVTDAPVFDVDCIEANLDGSLILLSGPQGILLFLADP